MKDRISSIGIFIFGLIGFITAYLALQAHYGTSDTGFCELGEAFSCDAVNQSSYATIFDIPFALIGMIGYITLFLALIWYIKAKSENSVATVLALSIIGFSIQLYLTFIEAFVLRMWCLLCVISQITIFLVLAFAIKLFIDFKKNINKSNDA